MKNKLTDTAGRRHYLIKKLNTLDTKITTLYVGIFNSCKNNKTQSHKHNFLEVMCVTSKVGFISINNETIEVKKGDIVLYFPRELHYEYGTETNDIEGIFFAVEYNENLKKILKPQPDCHVIKYEEDKAISLIFEGVLLESQKEDIPYTDKIVNCITKAIIFKIAQDFPPIEDKATISVVVEKIKQYIDEHYLEEISLEDLYKSIPISKFYASKLFKLYMGITPITYIINLRMEMACKLLSTTKKKIGEIAYEVGYKDIFYFTKSFKQEIGVTPNKYRKTKQ